MHVAVIGAGIVGVTTAYELAADGHRVTVFERHGTVAAEASFAHAGLASLGAVAGLASTPPRPRRWRGPAFLWPGRDRRRREAEALGPAVQRLAVYGRDRLQALTRGLQLDYERSEGCLLLWRTAADQALAGPGLATLAALGAHAEVLDAAGCRAIEPGLSTQTGLAGGLWLRDDAVGNGRQFTHLLRHEAERLGVRFRFHTAVERIEGGAEPRVVAVQAPLDDAGPRAAAHGFADTVPIADGPRARAFDAVVVCAAMGAPALLRPLGLRLPLQAVHGYSLTAPLRRHDLHPDTGPRSAVVDARHGIAVSRLGQRVRVAGVAEVGGRPGHIDPAAIESLHAVLRDWFPGAAQAAQAQRWKGARPTLPDGAPVLGPSRVAGVWLNLGHGGHGWTLACGSARWLADRLAGRPGAVDLAGLGAERFEGVH